MVFQPVITDADNNEVFMMEYAQVSLLNEQDVGEEHIAVSSSVVDALVTMGITVTGK